MKHGKSREIITHIFHGPALGKNIFLL